MRPDERKVIERAVERLRLWTWQDATSGFEGMAAADARKIADDLKALLSTPDFGEDRVDRDPRLSGITSAGLDQIEKLLDEAGIEREGYSAQTGGVSKWTIWGRILNALALLDPAPTDHDADASGGGESKGGQESVAPYSGSAVSAKPIATSAGVSADQGAEGSGGRMSLALSADDWRGIRGKLDRWRFDYVAGGGGYPGREDDIAELHRFERAYNAASDATLPDTETTDGTVRAAAREVIQTPMIEATPDWVKLPLAPLNRLRAALADEGETE